MTLQKTVCGDRAKAATAEGQILLLLIFLLGKMLDFGCLGLGERNVSSSTHAQGEKWSFVLLCLGKRPYGRLFGRNPGGYEGAIN